MRRHAVSFLLAAIASGAWITFVHARLSSGVPQIVISGNTYELLAPSWLYAIAIAPFFAPVLRFSLANLPAAQRALLFLSRALLVTLLAFALARPARTTESRHVSVAVLVDVSESVTDAGLLRAKQTVQKILAQRGDNDVRLATFAREPRPLELQEGSDTPPPISRHSAQEHDGDATDPAAALRLAYGLFPPGHLRRIALITDGQQTQGDLLSEAERASQLGVRVSAIPLRQGTPEEIAIRDLTLPERIEVGAPFRVRATLRTTRPRHARIRLYQGDTLNGLDGTREIDLQAGDTELTFESIARVPGPVTYTATVDPNGRDRFAANNRYVASAFVIGRPAVLLVEPDPSRATYLARALAANDFDVDVRTPREIPTAVSELARFDFFVLSDTPADQVSLGQIDAIERYVREIGGGFLMAGGTQSFALGGWQHSRIEQLLPVRMDPERRREQPSLALALVIDKSGSMAGINIELAKDAAKATAELLSSDDYLAVIAYDYEPSRIVRMQSPRNRLRILADIGRLHASGGTRILPALDAAYQDLSVTRAIVKHTILLTDGVTDENNADFEALVEAMRGEGITVSVVGLGPDVNRALLQRLATLGGGRAYFTRDAQNVPRIFMRETTTVQRSSAVEEYFAPVPATHADFLRGVDIGTAPYLHGFVATRMKPSPAQEILTTDTGEPLLARWRHGLGWSLAFTSDIKNRWAAEWLRWNGFGTFWSQLVREHMRQRRQRTLDMHAEVIDGIAHVSVDAIDPNDRFLNGLTSTLVIEGPLGARTRNNTEQPSSGQELPFRQTAPGLYEARVPLPGFGSFLLSATHQQDGHAIAESHAQIANPYPREYDLTDPALTTLEQAVRAGRGKIDPPIADLFDPQGETIRAHEPLWPTFVAAAIALFFLDLLLRRVRLFA